MLKKIVCVLLMCLLCVAIFAACDDTNTPNNDPVTPPSDDTTTPPDETEKEYTVTWKNEKGEILGTTKVKEGKVPTYEYTVADTAEWDYTMEGWATTQDGDAATLSAATADATYYAKVTKVKQKYTVTFATNGGSAVNSVTVEYGQSVSAPTTNPTKTDCRFAGWYIDTALHTGVTWPLTVTKNQTVYASWNDVVDIPAMLVSLLNGYNLNPYKSIPNSMKPGAAGNLVANASSVNKDYSSAVNVSSIRGGGFGEQWNMIVDNLQQTNTFFNVLTVVEGLTTTSVTAFNNYFDSNPGDTAHHQFASGIYSVTIDFDGDVLYYVLNYTATIPLLGEQTVQIAMSMEADTEVKTVRVQIGDANALKYTVSGDSYEFYIKYAGVRRAYFEIEEVADGVYEGHIKEFLTVSGVGIESAADFYINDNYVSAVGNKASGLLGFDGYICELYDVSTGKMLGYEVRETKDIVLIGEVTFNTLWFDLSYISGISTIRYDEENGKFYINGSSTAWEAEKVGGISKKRESRRFDIEFRTQYFYVYNAQEETYEVVKAQIPMFFVQEENYSTLVADVANANNINITVTLPGAKLNKLQADYDAYVDVFIENKAAVTEDIIIAAIGNKKTFG